MSEPKRLPGVRSLAGVPLKDPHRKGPPRGTYMPGSRHNGRKGALKSPWRTDNVPRSRKGRENAMRSGMVFRDGPKP